MRNTTRIIAAVAAATLATSACASDDGAASGPTTSGEAAAPTAPADDTTVASESGSAGAGAVEIDDFSYDPESITVPAGTEVTWTNVDPALHSVTAGTPDAPEPELFDLDDIDEAGETVSHTFEGPGTYEYFCRYHDFMLGTVEVTG